MLTKYRHKTTKEFVAIIDTHSYTQADVAELLHEAATRLDQTKFRKDPNQVDPNQLNLF